MSSRLSRRPLRPSPTICIKPLPPKPPAVLPPAPQQTFVSVIQIRVAPAALFGTNTDFDYVSMASTQPDQNTGFFGPNGNTGNPPLVATWAIKVPPAHPRVMWLAARIDQSPVGPDGDITQFINTGLPADQVGSFWYQAIGGAAYYIGIQMLKYLTTQ